MTIYEKFGAKVNEISNTPELMKKIYFTLAMFLVARLGTYITVPGVSLSALEAQFGALGESGGEQILDFISTFSGSSVTRFSIFSLGIIPYINASIVMSLLTVITPQLEEIQKEGEGGRNKITQWTRYLTITIASLQGGGIAIGASKLGIISPGLVSISRTTLIVVAGTVFLMWLGEQITLKGIGNGVSLLIFLNIISRVPESIQSSYLQLNKLGNLMLPIAIIIGIAALTTVAAIAVFQLAQRQVPIIYVGRGAKKSVAEKTYLPIKLNSAGVMPVIFASVLMSIPLLLLNLIFDENTGTFATIAKTFLGNGHWFYLICYSLVIVFFSFFYTAITFDPDKIADSLKQGGGTVPGIRPGEETADYLEDVIKKITWGGALFLAIIAVLPNLIFPLFNLPVIFGGTGIIIVVGVALDTMQQINAHLVTKEYKGFL